MDINNIRKDFPLLSRTMMDHPLIYFDNAATTLKPQCVIDAVTGSWSGLEPDNISLALMPLSE